MKKSELKSLIKECIKEVIFEEGVLSGIITEVASGMNNINMNRESQQTSPAMERIAQQSAQASKLMEDKRKEVMDAVASNNYEDLKKKFANPEFFAGTQPLQENKGQSALSNVPSGDAGLDISSIPGFGHWGSVAQTSESKKR
tara:strand:- start:6893 stop:7321 length:429 start_codon:yes stop_codon:yes gene_type:complete